MQGKFPVPVFSNEPTTSGLREIFTKNGRKNQKFDYSITLFAKKLGISAY